MNARLFETETLVATDDGAKDETQIILSQFAASVDLTGGRLCALTANVEKGQILLTNALR